MGRQLLCLLFLVVALATLRAERAVDDSQLGPSYSVDGTSDDVTMENMTLPNVTSLLTLRYRPPKLIMAMKQELVLHVNYTLLCNSSLELYDLEVTTSDPEVLIVPRNATLTLDCLDAIFDSEGGSGVQTGNFSVPLTSDLLGRSWLIFSARLRGWNASSAATVPAMPEAAMPDAAMPEAAMTTTMATLTTTTPQPRDVYGDHEISEGGGITIKRMVLVLRTRRVLDEVFQVIVYLFIIIATIGMGCKTDLEVVKEVLKKPVAPIIGFCCQYIGMPLIAFMVSKVVEFDTPAMAFGIFACGVCPGGGVSNIYSYLLGGDISLSVTMTTISTIAALGMIPLWMFILGRFFHDDKITIIVPYINIMITLSLVILPLFVGFFIKYKLPRVTKIIIKVIKPVTLITVIFLLSLGIYTNQYIFRLFKPSAILAGCMLPYIGYALGGVVSLICRLTWSRVKTVAIETGIQNVGVAFLMLMFALPPPDGDIAAAGPAASAVMTPLPLFVVTIPYIIYNKCKAKRKAKAEAEAGENPDENQNQNSKMEIRNGMTLGEVKVNGEELERLSPAE